MHLRHVLSITALGLAACGSGSSDATGTIPLNAANAEAMAATAMGASQGILEVASSGNVLQARVGDAGGTGGATFDLRGFVRERLLELVPQRTLPAILVETTSCPEGGQVTRTWNDADNNNELSTGDTIEILFEGCVENGVTTDGRIFLDGIVLSATPTTAYISLRMTFDQLTVDDGAESVTLDGSLSASLQMTETAITFQYTVSAAFTGQLVSLRGGSTMSLTVTDTDWTYTSNGGIDIGPDIGSLVYTTTQAFRGTTGGDNPVTGTMVVRGGMGSTLRIVAVDATQVRLEVDADGDGQFETTIATTWAALGM